MTTAIIVIIIIITRKITIITIMIITNNNTTTTTMKNPIKLEIDKETQESFPVVYPINVQSIGTRTYDREVGLEAVFVATNVRLTS